MNSRPLVEWAKADFMFLAEDGNEYGPVSGARLKLMFDERTLRAETQVRVFKHEEWQTLGELVNRLQPDYDGHIMSAGQYDSNYHWYYRDDKEVSGPHFVNHIKYLHENFYLHEAALVWHPDFGNTWKPLSGTGIIDIRQTDNAVSSRRSLAVVLILAALLWMGVVIGISILWS